MLQQRVQDLRLVRAPQVTRWHALVVAAIISWGTAFFEYMIQVPANRAGHTLFNVAQLKIVQKVISLPVFVPFAIF